MVFVTQTGYLMLVKSLADDFAWQVQRILVNSYFNQRIPYGYAVISKDKLIDLLESKAELAELKLDGWVKKQRWTQQEIDIAQAMRSNGQTFAAISARLNRSEESIRQKFLRIDQETAE